jgi:hypothetical protein
MPNGDQPIAPLPSASQKKRATRVVAGLGNQQRVIGPFVVGDVRSIFRVIGRVDVGRLYIDAAPRLSRYRSRSSSTAAGSVLHTFE